jgi:hypothetical protein
LASHPVFDKTMCSWMANCHMDGVLTGMFTKITFLSLFHINDAMQCHVMRFNFFRYLFPGQR